MSYIYNIMHDCILFGILFHFNFFPYIRFILAVTHFIFLFLPTLSFWLSPSPNVSIWMCCILQCLVIFTASIVLIFFNIGLQSIRLFFGGINSIIWQFLNFFNTSCLHRLECLVFFLQIITVIVFFTALNRFYCVFFFTVLQSFWNFLYCFHCFDFFHCFNRFDCSFNDLIVLTLYLLLWSFSLPYFNLSC